MYYVYLGGELAFDPLSDSPLVTSATVSQEANAAAYLDMSLVPSASPEVGQAVSVLWDGEVLFGGTVSEATRGIEGTWDVTAESGESRLGWVLVPPHSSSGSVGDMCPATVAGYVQWLAEALNRRAAGGWRVDVGVNEGALLAQGGALSVSEDSWRTVADLLDSNVLSLGGWLGWEPREGGATLSLYADVRDAASQVVELGANVADMSSGLSSDGLATAIVAYSGDLTLDGLSEDELALASNAGMMVSGGALYDPAAVALYGYREEREELQASTRADLVRASVARLRESSSPTRTVECRAVDMALAGGGPHLRVGQAVRVRAQPLGVDEYMVVRSVSLDLMDPDQTSYELGAAHDTLTGQQSARLRELNEGVSHSLDLASGAVTEAYEEYALSPSRTEPPTSGWSREPPPASAEGVVWRRTVTVTGDGMATRSAPVPLTGEPGVTLSIEADGGTVLRNSAGSTTLRAVVYQGSSELRTLAGVRAAFGAGASVEWGELGPSGWEPVAPADPRLSEGGMALTADGTDISGQATYRCCLVVIDEIGVSIYGNQG